MRSSSKFMVVIVSGREEGGNRGRVLLILLNELGSQVYA
jgi:hypothetical protein